MTNRDNNRSVKIGDEWVTVPDGYLLAEQVYCSAEDEVFRYSDTPKNRQAVLDKRVEFYTKYKKTLQDQISLVQTHTIDPAVVLSWITAKEDEENQIDNDFGLEYRWILENENNRVKSIFDKKPTLEMLCAALRHDKTIRAATIKVATSVLQTGYGYGFHLSKRVLTETKQPLALTKVEIESPSRRVNGSWSGIMYNENPCSEIVLRDFTVDEQGYFNFTEGSIRSQLLADMHELDDDEEEQNSNDSKIEYLFDHLKRWDHPRKVLIICDNNNHCYDLQRSLDLTRLNHTDVRFISIEQENGDSIRGQRIDDIICMASDDRVLAADSYFWATILPALYHPVGDSMLHQTLKRLKIDIK